MKKHILTIFLSCSLVSLYSNGQGKSDTYPPDIESALVKAGRNRVQLEIAIDYFRGSDPLKLKALYFLIANMDIHYSEDYYWADSTGKRIMYNEVDHRDWTTAINSFDVLKKKFGKLTPVRYTYRDLDTITGSFLIDNVQRAFSNYKHDLSDPAVFSNFCEYVLPYRLANEPLQDWRKVYGELFRLPKDDELGSTKAVFNYLRSEYDRNFINSFSIEKRTEPLPYLGALQILLRKKGLCEDIAAMEVFTLRSNGLPATTDVVVNWASSSGAHTLNATFDRNLKPIPFDILNENFTDTDRLFREPGKVIRLTYSPQKDVLASKTDTGTVPPGFLRTKNYIDVTREYWPVNSITTKLKTASPDGSKVFISVFNYSKWRPVWWGEAIGDSATFTDMAKGCVFLPVLYQNGKTIPAGYPIANGQQKQVILKPDVKNTRKIVLPAQMNYLTYRPGKIYRLYYWDDKWIAIGKQIAANSQDQMIFENVPSNALLLLRPEYSENKERPFIINETGERLWF